MSVPYKEVYTITEGGEKKRWTRIGVAFVNSDGSLNVKLDALPVNGQMNIRDPKPKDEAQKGLSGSRGRSDADESF